MKTGMILRELRRRAATPTLDYLQNAACAGVVGAILFIILGRFPTWALLLIGLGVGLAVFLLSVKLGKKPPVEPTG